MKLFGGKSDNPSRSTHNNSGNNRHDNIPQQRSSRPQQNSQRPTSGGNAQRPTPHQINNNVRKPSQQNSNPIPPKKKKSGKGWIIALIVLLTLVALFYAYWKLTSVPPELAPANTAKPQTETDNLNNDTEETDEVEVIDDGVREKGHYYTMLIVGKDQVGANTDTLMVMRYDAVDHVANIISIPRDTMVDIPEIRGNKKINRAYYLENGGIDTLMESMKGILGFELDSYIVVDTQVVADVIDALGGFDFDVPVDMYYDDPTQNFHMAIPKGLQHLNGEDAVKVWRYRATYGMGDIDRLDVQHDFLTAAASQMLKLSNVPNLISAASLVLKNAETDLDAGNIQWYAEEFFKMNMEDIHISTMPGNYSCVYKGLSHVVIEPETWLPIVNDQLNPYKLPVTIEDCDFVTYNAITGQAEKVS